MLQMWNLNISYLSMYVIDISEQTKSWKSKIKAVFCQNDDNNPIIFVFDHVLYLHVCIFYYHYYF